MKKFVRNAVTALTACTALTGFAAVSHPAYAADTASAAKTSNAVRPLEDPTPDCAQNGGQRPCWDYYTWYMTYEKCNESGANKVGSMYDTWLCEPASNGVAVSLWLHRR